MIPRIYQLLAGFLFMTALLLVEFQSPAYGEAAEKKATWVWQTGLIEDGGEELLDFAHNEGINLIYLQIDRNLSKETYEKFVVHAHENQVDVHALGGDPRWALQAHREDMFGLAEWVKEYNTEVSSESRFDGIHLDIEPYVLNQWETEREEIITSWQNNINEFSNIVSGLDLELGIDIPFWFDPIYLADGMSLNEWLFNAFDQVTVLAYRNTANDENGVIYQAKNELELGDRLGKKVLVAINTKDMPGENHTTFYGMGKDKMDQTIDQLSEALGSHISFDGLAVHDFLNWKNMPETSGEDSDLGEPKPPLQPEPEPEPEPEPGEWVPDAFPVIRDRIVRGTYIWEANEVIENRDEILEFAKEKNLNLLYVRLDLQQPFSSYSSFVKQASAAGIEVHAMGGHPIWALQENQGKILKLVNYVKNYNRAVQGDERFHGIHLDIEPYVLPDWRVNSQAVISEWTSNLEMFVSELKKDSNLQASMDMAVWLDKYKYPDADMSLSKWMIDRMDHVSLMAFRDSAEGSNGIATITKEEIAFGDELGKPVMITVEMKESHEGDHITFYEEGSAYMESEFLKLQDLLQGSPSYGGNLVHAYEYWKNAKP